MMTFGFFAGVALASPVFFVLGIIYQRDRHVREQLADIRAALRRDSHR